MSRNGPLGIFLRILFLALSGGYGVRLRYVEDQAALSFLLGMTYGVLLGWVMMECVSAANLALPKGVQVRINAVLDEPFLVLVSLLGLSALGLAGYATVQAGIVGLLTTTGILIPVITIFFVTGGHRSVSNWFRTHIRKS